MKFSELEDKIFRNYEAGAVTDDQLVQLIERAQGYLVLRTLSNTAIVRGKSYNGVKMHQKPDIVIDGVKLFKNNN